MRSLISALRSTHAAFSRSNRRHEYSSLSWPTLEVCGRTRQQRGCRPWLLPINPDHHCCQSSVILPRCCNISTSSSILSSPDSFHGLSLNDEAKETLDRELQQQQSNGSDSTKIQEAEVVQSAEDKIRTRQLIKEVTRAEMSAHSILSSSNSNNVKHATADAATTTTKDDTSLDENEEGSTNLLGPYERRLQQLNELQHRHQTIDPHQQPMEYAQSCLNMGDLHYQLGDMEQSQELYLDILKDLLSGSGTSEDDGGNAIMQEQQIMIAQCMHALGAIHARCGEYDEASRWYEESLKRKKLLSNDNGNGRASSSFKTSTLCHYELGKTYNGLAALEVMRGGDVHWDKAISLFREAERCYLRDFEPGMAMQNSHDNDQEYDEDHNPLQGVTVADVSKDVIRRMSPRHAESLVNVRSNMAELLRQRGQYDAAVETFRQALETATMAMESQHEKHHEGSGTNDKGIVDDAIPPPATSIMDEPTQEEQGNTIVDLLVKIADNLISAEQYNEAAEAYERALTSHVFFRKRRQSMGSNNTTTQHHPSSNNGKQGTILPALPTNTSSTKINFHLASATTIEAAIRNNLAHALAQIGQDKLSLEHYEASLKIKRHIGGDLHMEVGHTLMGMGALLGGPVRDFTRGLNCFKEALYIYRANLEEVWNVDSDGDGDGVHRGEDEQAIFGAEEEAEEIDRHVQNALKNIGLIEAALLKDRDGASKRRRR